MRDALLRLVQDAEALHNRLILVAGGDSTARSALLQQLADEKNASVLRLGVDFSRRLVLLPVRQRPLQAASLLRELVDRAFHGSSLVTLDRIEILFDRTLQLDPLEALKRLAHARTVIVNWPGEVREGRLTYAPAQHPEHRDYPVAGVVTLQLH